MHRFLLILLPLLLAGCQLIGPRTSNSDLRTVTYTVSFGECLGYCWSQLVVTADHVRITQKANAWTPSAAPDRGRTTPKPPDRAFQRPTAPAEWQRLIRVYEALSTTTLQPIYGCPDCNDGGAATINFSAMREVTYEYSNPPSKLRTLDEALNALYDEMRQAVENQ